MDTIELNAFERDNSVMKIDFLRTKDMRSKMLKFEIKGDRGLEYVNIVIRDSRTRRSVPFRVENITEDWNDVYIDLEKEAYNTDTSRIEHIRLELIPLIDGKAEKVFIRNVKFSEI